MNIESYIYSFRYDTFESELCKLETKNIFNISEKRKQLISDIKVEPSCSAFIKRRLDVLSSSKEYPTLIDKIKKEKICVEGFKVEYFVLDGDKTTYANRLEKLKDIGYSIEGEPDYYNPTITYGLCNYNGTWHFGVLIKNNQEWLAHNKKPYSYSNSISINIAKALVNIAVGNNKDKKIVDACCGAGTIMLEACFAGNNIEGCDINWKMCKSARKNLAHFNYTANIVCSDIKDLDTKYDVAIIDLPYNLLSSATDNDIIHIIQSASEITERLVIISTLDITNIIKSVGFNITDCCTVAKSGKTSFSRKIWVCIKA